jgi:antitoxin ParD1/3/4
MPNRALIPEFERFATACVDSGRYGSVSEVTRAGLRLLHQNEAQQQDFIAMLNAAEAEGEAYDFFSVDEVAGSLDAIIEEARRSTTNRRLE